MVHLSASINPSPLFQIRLEQDTLTMRGLQSESVGCVLRGQLVLVITEPTKFKEIKLTFQGKSKLAWADGVGSGQYYLNEERILFQHDWIFLPAKKQCTVLAPDNYHWDFELILPGTLPETIDRCELGKLGYKLKAVAERPAFALNLHSERKVTLQRSLLPSSFEYSQNSMVANTWTGKVDYEISVDSKVFVFGEKVTVSINLIPIHEGLKVHNLLCTLKEYATSTVGTSKKTVSKILRVHRENHFPCEGNSWNYSFEMFIPPFSACLCDSQNDIIKIKHKLKFFIMFANQGSASFSELIADIPIIISPNNDSIISSLIPAPLADKLPPTYDAYF
ncbi:14149_t:CDS:2, partial [Funneliformis geosporum]